MHGLIDLYLIARLIQLLQPHSSTINISLASFSNYIEEICMPIIIGHQTVTKILYPAATSLHGNATYQCKMSNLSNLFLKNFQGVRLIQNFIGQAQRESRLTTAVEHQEIPPIQL